MRIIICDSDQNTIQTYKKFIEVRAAEQGDATVEGLSSGERLLFEMQDDPNDVDVIVMDTVFEGKMDGIETIRQIREIGFTGEVVFLTSEKDRVFESFDVKPYNFLLKDEVTLERFAEVIDGAIASAMDRKKERLTLACAGDVRNIPIDDITYFELSDRIVEVHYGDEVFEFFSTLEKIENQLYGRDFIRTHKSFLVNARHVDVVRSGELVTDRGDIIPIAPKYEKFFGEVRQ